MKRLAVLALTAGVGLSAGRAAGDWQRPAAPPATALPAPTGMMAPTAPMVPAPQAVEAAPGVRLRDRFGGGRAVTAPTAEPAKPGPVARLFQRTPKEYVADPYDPYPAKKAWCEPCGPAVRHPLPPLPAGLDLGAYGVRRASAAEPAPPAAAPQTAAAGGCATGACGADAGRPSPSCWDCFKGWLCYRQTPVHLPLIPTERNAPLYTYGTCREGTGHGAGCAGGVCGTGHGVAGRVGSGAGCTPCPVAGETVMPGYRLANPELPGLTPQRAAGPVVSPVLPAGHKATAPAPVVPASERRNVSPTVPPPAPAVPYKTGTANPNQRPFIGQ